MLTESQIPVSFSIILVMTTLLALSWEIPHFPQSWVDNPHCALLCFLCSWGKGGGDTPDFRNWLQMLD